MARIAVLQMTSGIDPAENAATMELAIARAADGGAVMLFTPEMSGLLDRNRERAGRHKQHDPREERVSAAVTPRALRLRDVLRPDERDRGDQRGAG